MCTAKISLSLFVKNQGFKVIFKNNYSDKMRNESPAKKHCLYEDDQILVATTSEKCELVLIKFY